MRLIHALALTFALALPATAQQNMTDADREAFRAEVRAYLLENPEVIREAIGVLKQRDEEAATRADMALVSQYADQIFNDGHSFVGGNPDGDITIVEFMDYRCSYCKRAFPEVESLLSTDGNIRYVVKEYPILGDESVLAAQYAIAVQLIAGDDAYEMVHNTLMQLRTDITEAALIELAGTLDLDLEAIKAKMVSAEVNDIINANRQLGSQLAIDGTPTFVVQTQMLRGYVPLADMQRIVATIRG
jgi:protein-disulfide isomerase